MSDTSKELLVYRSKVKKASTLAGATRLSGDFVEALSDEVEDMISRAVERAKDNGRSTLKPCDL